MPIPSLFGLKNSNRDFSLKKDWGKNQFNSSFPASLSCYLYSQEYKANYLSINNGLFMSSWYLSFEKSYSFILYLNSEILLILPSLM